MNFPPRISGAALRTLARFSRTRAGARTFYQFLRADLRVGQLEELPDELFGDMPIDNRPLAGRPPRTALDAGLPPPPAAWTEPSSALVAAYRSGARTPLEVLEKVLAGARSLAARTPSLGPLLDTMDDEARSEAEASARRWREGKPVGSLDGVPIAVKEHIAVKGRRTSCGSDLAVDPPAALDATVVARLRAAGAIVVGRTPMTEFGMTPLGFNPKRAMPRNPHAVDRVAGGSSTGSAVAVATGLVPFALGSDGGGSIRIPAALCGVFGVKPTWGRVSLAQASAGSTVTHVGPLASSTRDLAVCLDVTSGFDPADLQTQLAPQSGPVSFQAALSRGVRGMRIGVVESEWADASPAVSRAGRQALGALERDGAKLVDVRLALARWAAPVGYATIGMEALSARRGLLAARAEFTPDLSISFSALSQLRAPEYAHAQRLRGGLRLEVARTFCDVDLLALPAAATSAPRVTDAEFDSGFLDARALDAMCRFMFLANLTGLPALSAPVGLDEAGLPLGLQLVGDAWDEETVLAAAAHLERVGAARVARPALAPSN